MRASRTLGIAILLPGMLAAAPAAGDEERTTSGWLRIVPGDGRSGCCYGLEVGPDGAARLAQAGDGTVAVDGRTATGFGGHDVVLTRIAADGAVDWIRSAGGRGPDFAAEIAVGPDGATYLVGTVAGDARFGEHFLATGGRAASFLARYSAAGRCEWVQRIAGDPPDGVTDVAVDPQGAAVVAGTRIRPFSRGDAPDTYVAKYAPNGSRRWERRAEGTGRDVAVAVDADGRIYVSGATPAADSGSGRMPLNGWPLVAAYDAGGAFLWRWQPPGARPAGPARPPVPPDSASARAVAVAPADGGGCWLLGEVTGLVRVGDVRLPGLRDRDVFLTRLDGAGREVWTRRFGGPHEDHAFDVAPAPDGGCVVSGGITRSASFPPWEVSVPGESAGFLAAYDAAGDCRWVRVVEGAGVRPLENSVFEVATGPDGAVWTGGWFRDVVSVDGRTVRGGADAVFLGRIPTAAVTGPAPDAPEEAAPAGPAEEAAAP